MSDKILDFDGVMERLDHDQELYHEIVHLFFDSVAGSVKAIVDAGEKGDAALLGSAAHSIKGALGNLGAMRAYRKALEIETAGKNGAIAKYKELTSQLEEEISAFRKEYAELRKQLR